VHLVLARRLWPAFFLALPACHTSTAGGGGGSVPTGSVCDTDPRAAVYAVGLSAKSADGAVHATFVDAMPAPPSKGENAWTIKLTDAMGSPINGATVTVKPFMPDHGHGSSVLPLVQPDTSGTYLITQLDFFMPGIWQITLAVAQGGGQPDNVVFTFCVDG
jgi:hypothetical protein